jgi:AraC-like DNA-binding protein
LPAAFLFNFYKISYKAGISGRIKYGQGYYDFDEGGLVFTSRSQLLAIAEDAEYMGNTLIRNSFNKRFPNRAIFEKQLNVSPHYLSDMLRSLTGQNAQQHIPDKLIEKAKEILSVSNLSVAEVAYQSGFEHPQSFNKHSKEKRMYLHWNPGSHLIDLHLCRQVAHHQPLNTSS